MIRWWTLHGQCMIAYSGKRRVITITIIITKLPLTIVTTVRALGAHFT